MICWGCKSGYRRAIVMVAIWKILFMCNSPGCKTINTFDEMTGRRKGIILKSFCFSKGVRPRVEIYCIQPTVRNVCACACVCIGNLCRSECVCGIKFYYYWLGVNTVVNILTFITRFIYYHLITRVLLLPLCTSQPPRIPWLGVTVYRCVHGLWMNVDVIVRSSVNRIRLGTTRANHTSSISILFSLVSRLSENPQSLEPMMAEWGLYLFSNNWIGIYTINTYSLKKINKKRVNLFKPPPPAQKIIWKF